ncbi:MAG: membrane protease subunit HflC [Phenylobacterium sp.]|jgi:membrane protease subunit HflC
MKNISIILVIFILILSVSSLFVVKEGQRGIVIQFGKVKKDIAELTVVYEPGLHFKLPFVEKVKILDARIQTLDDAPVRFVTVEKKDLMVDSYIKWKINDFAKYFLTTGALKSTAERLLKQKVNNGLRTAFGSRTIADIVSGERNELMTQAQDQAQLTAVDLGIEIIDVRVKQINLPLEVSNSIYKRMRAERSAVAKEHRSEGNEQAEILRANVDAKVTVMLAEAEKKALTVRGRGDATAAQIYSDTFTKDAEFYAFTRSLEAYRNSFRNKNDVMVLKPDSDFFNYMKVSSGKKKE